MARAEAIGFDNLELTLKAMSDCPKACLRAVQEAIPVVEQAMRQATASSIKNGYALVASLQATPAKKNKWGSYSVVRPVGVDKRGRRFGEIFAYVEYGTRPRVHTKKGKDGQTRTFYDKGLPAHNIRAQAKRLAEQRVHDIFERTLKEAFKQ